MTCKDCGIVLADNAALTDALEENACSPSCAMRRRMKRNNNPEACKAGCAQSWAYNLLSQPHPGAPLLEVLRECEMALVRLRKCLYPHTVRYVSPSAPTPNPDAQDLLAVVDGLLARIKEVLPGE